MTDRNQWEKWWDRSPCPDAERREAQGRLPADPLLPLSHARLLERARPCRIRPSARGARLADAARRHAQRGRLPGLREEREARGPRRAEARGSDCVSLAHPKATSPLCPAPDAEGIPENREAKWDGQ